MTAQDVKEMQKELEKAQVLLGKFITEGKDTSRLLRDITYLKAMIGPKGGEQTMAEDKKVVEPKKEVKVEAPKVAKPKKVEVQRVVVTVKKITVNGVSEEVSISTDTDNNEWKLFRTMRKLFRPLYTEMMKGKAVEVKFE